MKLTTEYCKSEIVKWIKECGYDFNLPENGWKRVRKYKNGDFIVRDFTNNDFNASVVSAENDTRIEQITETECLDLTGKPSDYYFQLEFSDEWEDIGGFVFFITKKSHYDKYGYLDDCCGSHNTPMPPDFTAELMEATWDYNGDPQVGRQSLLNAGFTEKKMV